VLVALGGAAQQVGPPHGQVPWCVLWGVGVLTGEPESALLEFSGYVLVQRKSGFTCLVGQVQGVAVEGRVGGHPPHTRGLRDDVGGGHAREQALSQSGGDLVGAEPVTAILAAVQVPVRGLHHLAWRAYPVSGRCHLVVAGEWAGLLLTDVVCPTTAVDPLAAGEGGQGEEGPVDGVGVEPVVGACAPDEHGASV